MCVSVICERFDAGAKGSYALGAAVKLSRDLRGCAIYDTAVGFSTSNLTCLDMKPSKVSSICFGLIAVVVLLGLPVSIAAGAASISLDKTGWDFGIWEPGVGPTEPVIFTVTNTGDTNLDLYVMGVGSFGAIEPGLFEITENKCFEASPLAPGESCTTGVVFDPSTPGPKLGMFDVSANPLAPVIAVAQLAGTGAGAIPSPPLPPDRPPVPLPRPRVVLVHHPPRKTSASKAVFRFRARLAAGFLCRLDKRPTFLCESPLRLDRLRKGEHRLTIRAVNGEQIKGPPLRFRWWIEDRASHEKPNLR